VPGVPGRGLFFGYGYYTSRMCSYRFIARALSVLFALVGFSLTARAADYSFSTQHSNPSYALTRDLTFKGSGTIWWRWVGVTTWSQVNLTTGGVVVVNTGYDSYNGTWVASPLGTNVTWNTTVYNVPDQKTLTLPSKTFEYTRNTSQGVQGTMTVPTYTKTVEHTRNSALNAGNYNGTELTAVSVSFGDGSLSPAVTDPNNPLPKAGDVLLLFNNKTGSPKTVTIQGKEVELQPGWNTLRYQGPVDATTGYPTADGLGLDIPYVGKTGADGVKYVASEYTGVYSGDAQLGFGWQAASTGITITGQSVTGAMLTIPGDGGGPTTLVGLAPVGQQSLNNTSTTTATISNPNTTPPPTPTGSGTTSTGAVSGSSSGTGATSGGAAVAASGTAGEGGFYNAPGLGDVLSEGQGIANELKNTVGGVGDTLKGKTWKWWNIGEAGIGQDSSWLETNINILGRDYRLINADMSWIAWLRAMLVVGVKVSFVVAVIKLFLK
jgi:hypothetical protein